MKKLNAFALCAAMVPAYTVGITGAFAAEPQKTPEAQQEASDSMAGEQESETDRASQRQESGMDYTTEKQDSGVDRSQSAPNAETGDESGMKSMSKDDSQKPHDGEQRAMSGGSQGSFHANDLIGAKVNSRNGDVTIGSINDLVFSEDGRITAVIVGVGGFLGVGEKEVAIPWSELERSLDADGKGYTLTVNQDEQSLKDAPTYERKPLPSASSK